jgi:hypothetical protein
MGDARTYWRSNKFTHSFNVKALTEITTQEMQGQQEDILSYRTRFWRFKLD